MTGLGLLATLSTSVVYGLGGELVIHGALQLGAMVALATLLTRLYGPITSLSNVQVNVMTALVSFDRVFEVLDLKPLIAERPGATVLRRPHGCRARRAGPRIRPRRASGTRPHPRSRWPRWSRSRCRWPSGPGLARRR